MGYGTADSSIGFRIVEVGNGSAHQITQDVGIIGSPATAIPLAPHGAPRSPKSTGGVTACAPLKIARIFLQNACQYSVAQEIAGEVVGVGGAETLGVSLHPLSVFGKGIFGLIDTGKKGGKEKRPAIRRTLEEELILLRGL